ncbi:unnamed protein product [Arctogadus glacialis]
MDRFVQPRQSATAPVASEARKSAVQRKKRRNEDDPIPKIDVEPLIDRTTSTWSSPNVHERYAYVQHITDFMTRLTPRH